MSNNNIEIIELFEEKTDAMFEALQEMIYKEGLRIGSEINMHRRDEHLGYWDPTYYLEYGREQDGKIRGFCEKMREASKKLAELIKAETPIESS